MCALWIGSCFVIPPPLIKNTIPYAQTRINIWACVKWNGKWNDWDQKLIMRHLAQIYLFRLLLLRRDHEKFKPILSFAGNRRQRYILWWVKPRKCFLLNCVFLSIRGQTLLENAIKNPFLLYFLAFNKNVWTSEKEYSGFPIYLAIQEGKVVKTVMLKCRR